MNAAANTLPAASTLVTAAQSEFIAKVQRLRALVWCHHYDVAAEVTRHLSRAWKDGGIEGLRAGCWDVAQILAEVPGSWDCYTMARDLAEAA